MEKVVFILIFLFSFSIFSQGTGNTGGGGPGITLRQLNEYDVTIGHIDQGGDGGGPGITLRELNDLEDAKRRFRHSEPVFKDMSNFENIGEIVDVKTTRFGVQDIDSFLDTHRSQALIINDSLWVDRSIKGILDYQTTEGEVFERIQEYRRRLWEQEDDE